MAKEDPYGFIYITTNTVNGKRYIGKRKFSVGWEGYLGSGKRLKQALKEYGRSKFKRVIIDFAFSDKELCELEMKYIRFFNADKSRDYYNIHEGGVMKGKPGKESYWYGKKIPRQMIEKANRKRVKTVYKYDLNGNLLEEYESLVSASIKNGVSSQGISLSCRDESKSCGGFFWSFNKNDVGRVYDKTRNHNPHKVVQCDKETGDELRIFESAKIASEMTGVCITNIFNCCNGNRKTAGGYKWRKVA